MSDTLTPVDPAALVAAEAHRPGAVLRFPPHIDRRAARQRARFWREQPRLTLEQVVCPLAHDLLWQGLRHRAYPAKVQAIQRVCHPAAETPLDVLVPRVPPV